MRELEFPRERTGVSPLGNCVWPNDGMDGVCMRSFIVRFVFVSDTACPYVRFVFSPFRFCSSLRSPREVCLRAVMCFLHADYAESAEFFIFLGVLRWRWRGRKLRYDESAQRGSG